MTDSFVKNLPAAPHVWQVGALCKAVGDALEQRFNPVSVSGELSGYVRAASGHCYFSLKDDSGQLRCAMFRRASSTLNFSPRDGNKVEVRGRLGVYEPRGELQLLVESMRPAGQGALFEQFLQRKLLLEREGLFDPGRKKALPAMPNTIGVVTSLGAAALHDVVTALRRRVPHISVIIAPASVQGSEAPAELIQALKRLIGIRPDVILLVRGGGSMEDLWAFNDEQLVRTIAGSPVPVVSGIGHETDFTLADFAADLRAPTPTAAAEMVAQPTAQLWAELDDLAGAMWVAMERAIDRNTQRLDRLSAQLGRPSTRLQSQQLRLASLDQRIRHGTLMALQQRWTQWSQCNERLLPALHRAWSRESDRTGRAELRLELLNPQLVLKRGYALLHLPDGHALTHTAQAQSGLAVRASLTDGTVDLLVASDPSV